MRRKDAPLWYCAGFMMALTANTFLGWMGHDTVSLAGFLVGAYWGWLKENDIRESERLGLKRVI